MATTDAHNVHPLLTADQIRAMPEKRHVHSLNPSAIRHTHSVGDAVGMTQIGVHLVRVEPGHASTEFHFHHQDEEFVYILSGRGVAEIGAEKFEIGPGDFMGFVAGSLPHSMFNPYPEDLVYLVGGNRFALDVCDYPRIRMRRYRVNGVNEHVSWDAIETRSASRK